MEDAASELCRAQLSTLRAAQKVYCLFKAQRHMGAPVAEALKVACASVAHFVWPPSSSAPTRDKRSISVDVKPSHVYELNGNLLETILTFQVGDTSLIYA